MTPSRNSHEPSIDETSQSTEMLERDSPDSPPTKRTEPPAKILKPVFISASVIIFCAGHIHGHLQPHLRRYVGGGRQ